MTTFLIVWLVTQAVGTVLIWGFTVGLGAPATRGATPPVAVIIAVKGRDPEFDGFLECLFAQDYPTFRVVFAVGADGDPALSAIAPYLARMPGRVSFVVAGEGADEGQKTTNLRTAVAHLDERDEILVFADADIWPQRDWLRRLVAPLVNRQGDIVTGFPWLIVKDGKAASYMLTSLAASVATIPRLSVFNGAWGGSSALTREHFLELDMAEQWKGVLSDDLQLTNVANAAGDRIVVPREILLRTAVHTSGWGDVIAEARRWYMLVRVHMPAAYFATILAMAFGALGWIVALGGTLALYGNAALALAAALVLSLLRTAGRARIVYRLWGKAGLAENRSYFWVDWLISPVGMAFSALCGWSALFMRRTTWSGTTYEVRGPRQVKIVSRRRASQP
jgi:hypothetical protein